MPHFKEKSFVAEERTAIKRKFAMIYYDKNGQRIKQNSGGHLHHLLKVVKRQLEAKVYKGAIAAEIRTHARGTVKARFILDAKGKAQAVSLRAQADLEPTLDRQMIEATMGQLGKTSEVLTVDAVKAGGARFRMGRFQIEITVAE
jgi:hypothetical protein